MLCLDRWQWPSFGTESILSHHFLDQLIAQAHEILGSSVHLHPYQKDLLILTVPKGSHTTFVHRCHAFRTAILNMDFDGLVPKKVLLVITSNREGETPECAIHRLLKGQVISETQLDAQGICVI